MISVLKDLRAATVAMLVAIVLCGVIYPLAVTGISQVAFHSQANGELVSEHGHVIGSKEIGQSFAGRTAARYFQTRPSATSPTPDNDAQTAFGNYGPNSTITLKQLRSNIAAYIKLGGRYVPGGLTAAKLPVDAIDTSASGVDPDISVANAHLQAYRIAAVRHIPLSTVNGLVGTYTGSRGLGFSGEPGVNVLELNLALDRSAK